MSGHSKWANIKHRKAAQDSKRGKRFMETEWKKLRFSPWRWWWRPGKQPTIFTPTVHKAKEH